MQFREWCGNRKKRKRERRLTVPLRPHLLAHRLRPPLHGEFTRVVERIPGKRDPAPHRADIHHHAPHLPTSSARVNVSHNPHRMPRHPHRAPEVRLDAPPRVLLARVLRVPEQVVPGVVDHDVEAAEAVQGGGHGGVDRVRRSDVEGLLEKPWVVRGKVVEGRGVSGGRDEAVVRLGGYQLAEGLADAGGAAGDEPDGVAGELVWGGSHCWMWVDR